MFHEKPKRKVPRPTPLSTAEYKSKSSFNLAQSQINVQSSSVVEWSTFSSQGESSQPSGAKVVSDSARRGSMSSYHSNSSTSLESDGRGPESASSSLGNSSDKIDLRFSSVITVNINPDNGQSSPTATSCETRIIRPQVKKAAEMKKETSPNSSRSSSRSSSPAAEVEKETSRNSSRRSSPMPKDSVTIPYGIALYEFKATRPGDLGFKEKDVIYLLRRVCDDLLYGRTSLGKAGIFPQEFIRIEVPIPGDIYNATAVYEFNSQAPGDLPLVPGQVVRVLLHISQDWLYGSSNGKSGQFPKCFVR